jgi:WD40 repeat protein
MKPNAGRMRRAMLWLGVAWLSLVAMSPLSAQQATNTLQGHTDSVLSVAFSPDGKTLASGGGAIHAGEYNPGELKLWDVATGKERATLKGHTIVVSVAFSPDGKTLASGSQDETVKLWDVATGKERATLKGHTSGVMSVAYSPDGETLALGQSGPHGQAVGRGDGQGTGHPQGTHVLCELRDV